MIRSFSVGPFLMVRSLCWDSHKGKLPPLISSFLPFALFVNPNLRQRNLSNLIYCSYHSFNSVLFLVSVPYLYLIFVSCFILFFLISKFFCVGFQIVIKYL